MLRLIADGIGVILVVSKLFAYSWPSMSLFIEPLLSAQIIRPLDLDTFCSRQWMTHPNFMGSLVSYAVIWIDSIVFCVVVCVLG